MNIQKLNSVIDVLKDDLQSALLTADIWTVADGQSISGFNPQPKVCALFNQITSHVIKALKASDYPALGKYYILDLVGGKMVVIIPLGDFLLGMLIDTKKAQLGLLLNLIIPKVIDSFEGVLKS
jgi:hypothetical protein